jgi:hypothetical protein
VARAVQVERRDREGPAEAAESVPAGSSAAAINASTSEAINRIAARAAIVARLTSLSAPPVFAGRFLVATRSTRHTPANPEASAAVETAASRTKYVATSRAQSISPAVTRRPRRSQAVRSGAVSSGRACRRRGAWAGGTGGCSEPARFVGRGAAGAHVGETLATRRSGRGSRRGPGHLVRLKVL